MKNIVISMFVFPWEIDALERVLIGLKESSFNIHPDIKFHLSITLDTSSNRIDWEKSQIPWLLFADKLGNLKKICDWCECDFDYNTNGTVGGSAAKRRADALKYKDKVAAYVWLDTDIFFPKHILYALSTFVYDMKDQYYIITPEIIKYWDDSWNIITNKKYMSQPYNHRDFFDMFSLDNECMNMDATHLEQINGFKFGGGWFTCISHDLMQKATVPEFIGEYGPDDTWITSFSQSYNAKYNRILVKQHVMRNMVVTEIGLKYTVENHYKKYLNLKNVDIEAHKAKIWHSFKNELELHLNKV